MHPLYQIMMIITVNNEHHVDRCNNFGNRASQKIWQSFISLVMWILVFKCGLKRLKCYVDDKFSFSRVGDVAFYEPYNWNMPREQVEILHLWDEIGLPHDDLKQISGSVIPCICFDVNPNLMTVTINPEMCSSLIEACDVFLTSGKRRSLWDFQCLCGHINWALNVYPHMRPVLSTLYDYGTPQL